MTKNDEARMPLPPYVSFKTFQGFIQKLHELSVIPDQIDSSVLRSYANSVGRQIVSTLKYLKLIGPNGQTNEQLGRLVAAFDSTEKWQEELTTVIFDAYQPIVGGLNLDAATSRQLEERFRSTGADGEVLRKCVGFFMAAVAASGVSMSPHITNKPKQRPDRGRTPKKARTAKAQPDEELLDSGQHESASVKFSFPVPEKGAATIFVPRNIEEADWDMINVMMNAYIRRLQKDKA
jgi:hypothetical protein